MIIDLLFDNSQILSSLCRHLARRSFSSRWYHLPAVPIHFADSLRSPPTDCGPVGSWAGISLNFTVTSNGTQFDRLGIFTFHNVECPFSLLLYISSTLFTHPPPKSSYSLENLNSRTDERRWYHLDLSQRCNSLYSTFRQAWDFHPATRQSPGNWVRWTICE